MKVCDKAFNVSYLRDKISGCEWLTMHLSQPMLVLCVLLAETLLAFLPTMSTHNITYDILKEYQIVPLQSGLMQHKKKEYA